MQLWNRFLDTPSGNVVIVAMDHGLALGAMEGFADPAATLQAVLEGKPDGVIVGPHFARHLGAAWADRPDFRLVLTADTVFLSTIPGEMGELELQTPLFSPSELVALGAVAVKILLIFGRRDAGVFLDNVRYVARLAGELHRLSIPLVVEPLLWGSAAGRPDAPRLIEHACRLAFELGADIIKAPYTADQDSFRRITAALPVPVLILGGPRTDAPQTILETVAEAIAAGARGVMLGRNVWQQPSPGAMVRAVRRIVHEGWTPEQAAEELV